MNRYGQIRDLLLGDLTASIFVFGVIVTILVLISLILSNKEKINYEKTIMTVTVLYQNKHTYEKFNYYNLSILFSSTMFILNFILVLVLL